MGSRRRSYSKEFKLEAVAMTNTGGKTISEVADDLGIEQSMLRHWRMKYQELGESGFPGHGNQNLTPEEAEIRRLKMELEVVREERDILKKAVAIFSKKPKY
jgi:transposase